jgi:hypothetical protein
LLTEPEEKLLKWCGHVERINKEKYLNIREYGGDSEQDESSKYGAGGGRNGKKLRMKDCGKKKRRGTSRSSRSYTTDKMLERGGE